MPIIKSATKRAKQRKGRTARRLPTKTYMKTMVRKVMESVNEGKKSEAVTLLPEAFKSIDMALKRHIIHRNTAARKKSALSKLIAAAK